jgi:hypothetical protein
MSGSWNLLSRRIKNVTVGGLEAVQRGISVPGRDGDECVHVAQRKRIHRQAQICSIPDSKIGMLGTHSA